MDNDKKLSKVIAAMVQQEIRLFAGAISVAHEIEQTNKMTMIKNGKEFSLPALVSYCNQTIRVLKNLYVIHPFVDENTAALLEIIYRHCKSIDDGIESCQSTLLFNLIGIFEKIDTEN